MSEEVQELSNEEKLALFEAVEEIENEELDASDALEEVRKRKSEAIKAIEETLGNKGPFKWKGRILTITKRRDTYFFRTRKESGIEDIG